MLTVSTYTKWRFQYRPKPPEKITPNPLQTQLKMLYKLVCPPDQKKNTPNPFTIVIFISSIYCTHLQKKKEMSKSVKKQFQKSACMYVNARRLSYWRAMLLHPLWHADLCRPLSYVTGVWERQPSDRINL